MRYLAIIWGIFLVVALSGRQSDAQIILDFTRTASGGVRVVGTGSGNTTNFGFASNWQMLDFDNDFISDSIGHTNLINADTVTGTISNSWGVSRDITGFSVNRSAASNDDAAFTTNSNMFFWINQPYTMSFEAIFNSSTLSADDLINGTYVDNTASGGSEIFGSTTLNVSVPEPASLGMFTVVGVVFITATHRKRKKKKIMSTST